MVSCSLCVSQREQGEGGREGGRKREGGREGERGMEGERGREGGSAYHGQASKQACTADQGTQVELSARAHSEGESGERERREGRATALGRVRMRNFA